MSDRDKRGDGTTYRSQGDVMYEISEEKHKNGDVTTTAKSPSGAQGSVRDHLSSPSAAIFEAQKNEQKNGR